MRMTDHDPITDALVVIHSATIPNPPSRSEALEELPAKPDERKQWLDDLRLQIDMSAQSAAVCRGLSRR